MTLAVRQEVKRSPLRALIVEDSEDDALLLLRELRRAGYEPDYERVETPEAMERALGRPWDVIFSDYRLPGFDAPEALKMWYASSSEAPFILVSGNVGEDVAARAIKAGAYDYVMKDNLTRLRAVVERSLQEAREKQNLRQAGRELQRREAILDAVRFAADQFLGEAVGWEESVRMVLKRLGEATETSRAYIFETHTDRDGELRGAMRYEWTARGVASQMDNASIRSIAYRKSGYGRWIETLGRGELVYGHTRQFPEGERWALRSQNILSIVVVPIFVEGRLWGHIGFDECAREREWSAAEVSALGAAAGTLGAAIRRRQMEERLRGSEERYRAVIEQATDGIYLLDAGTRRIVETNPAFRRLFGYTADEVREMDIYDLVAHPRENVDATIERTLDSGQRVVGERKYRRKDGTLLDVEVGVSVISLDGRDVICTIIRDVTERKRNEEALRDSEAEMRAVFGAMNDVILVLDGEGRYLKVAPTTFSPLYRPPEQLVGRTIHDTFPREQADKILGSIRRALETRERVDIEYGLQVAGQEMWFTATITPMTEDLVVAVARDVTGRKRDEEALARSEGRLRQIIETEPECVKVLGANGSLLEMNPAGLSMIEADSLEQVRGKSVYSYIVREHRANFVELTERVLRGGSGTLEFELVGLKGTRRWLDTHAVPLRDAGGEVAGLLAITRDITERKQAEQALKQSERLYRAVIEQATENIFLIDVETRRVVESNRAFREALGYSEEELRGMTLYDFVTADRESVDRNLRRTLEEGRVSVGERRYRRKDGALVDVEVGGSIILRDGRETLVAVAHDITERKKNEEALRESEERFRGAFESAAIGMALVEPDDGRWLRVNQPLCDIVGYPEQELLSLTFQDITHPDDLDADLREVERTLRGEIRAFQMEKRYIHKDGHVVWILLSVSLVRDYEGSPLYFISQMQDITQRKRAEEALRESEERFRSAFEGAAVGMALEGLDGRYLEVNQTLSDMVGYSLQEMSGMDFQEITHPDDLDEDLDIMRQLVAGEISSGQMEKRYVHKDGRVVWALVSASLVRDADGEPLYVIGQIQDITQRKRAEEALEESRRTLATLMSNLPGMAYRCRNDKDWTMQFVSEGSSELTGHSPADLIDNSRVSYGDLIHPDDQEGVWNEVQAALQEHRPFQFTYRITTASGTMRWVWEQGQGVFSPDGALIALEGFVTDTTERKRVQELLEERVSTLSGIASNLTLDLPVENTLDVLANSVVGASTAVACGVILAGEESDSVNLFGSYGLPEGYTAGLQEAYRTGVRSPSLEALHTRRPVLVRDLRRFLLDDPRYAPIHRFVHEAPWDIVYSLPLLYRGRALGAIFFCFLPGQEPGEDEKVFLQAVADQAAVAVENVRLFSEARGKAALEERQRLARELHDSVSQALYGISLGAETARELLRGDDPERAAEPLDYTVSLAEAGMTEMRALIFELRPESLEKEGLVAALAKQAAAIEARHGIRVKADMCSEPEAPLEAKEALYRVAQEALHNVVKHAQAANVEIEMWCQPDLIEFKISDDGIGFDARGDFPGHLGLRSMRERASRLGGTLEIESAPGKGSRIVARIPIHQDSSR